MNSAQIGVAIISIALLVGCSAPVSNNNDGSADETVKKVDELTAKQESWTSCFSTIAAGSGKVAAMDSIADIIAKDPEVAQVYRFQQGINVELKNGFGGTLLLNPHRGHGDTATIDTSLNKIRSLPKINSGRADALKLPKGKKTIYLAAMYGEFLLFDNGMRRVGNENFPKVGYEEYEFYSGSQVTVARLSNLGGSDYAFIRLSSHGVPWPLPEVAAKVYFVTGQIVNSESKKNFAADLKSGDIRIVTDSAGTSYFEISADYFASKNNWGESKPFIYLGFCYSWFGGWPAKCVASGAGGILAYNWSIQDQKDLEWTNDFTMKMCDTTLDFPYFLEKWYDQSQRSFFDDELGVLVSLMYKGEDSLAFWKPFRLQALMPSAALCGDTIQAFGVQFSDTTGKVLFDNKSGEILDWTDSIIKVVIPQGFSQGQSVPVKVVAHQDTTNEKTLVISRISFNTCDIGIKAFGHYTTSDGPLDSWLDIKDIVPGTTQGGVFTGTLTEGSWTTRVIVNFNLENGKLISASYSATLQSSDKSGFTKATLTMQDPDAFGTFAALWQGDENDLAQSLTGVEDELHSETYNAQLISWEPTGAGGKGSFKVHLYNQY